MNRLIVFIVFIIVGSVVTIAVLVTSEGGITSKNAFERKIIYPKIELKKAIELPNHAFAFVGNFNEVITLKSYIEPLKLFKYSGNSSQLETVYIKYPSNFNIAAKNIYKDFKPPHLYLSNEFGDISVGNLKTTKAYNRKDLRFDQIKALSDENVIVRTRFQEQHQKNRGLAKLTLKDRVTIQKTISFPGLNNAIFSNDGLLHYDQKDARIIYMYLYRGELLCLDTNLKTIYLAKTIDTVRSTKIKTGILNGYNKGKPVRRLTQTAPPKIVNKYITTDEDKIYLISLLRADNENQSIFKTKQIVDVYDLQNGMYQYSFYIPKYHGGTLNQFLIKNQSLVTISGRYLLFYNIAY